MKGYLLAISGMATLAGFTVILVPTVLLGLVLGVLGIKDAMGYLVGLGTLAAVVSAVLHIVWCNRYVSRLSDFEELVTRGHGLLFKVESGRVVEIGQSLWGKKGIYPISIPFVHRGEFGTSVRLDRRVNGLDVSIRITLTAHVPEEKEGGDEESTEGLRNGFSPQELFGTVISEKCLSVEEWLARAFKQAAEGTPAVQEAFEDSARYTGFELTQAVQKALREVHFVPVLSNISCVEATVVVDSYSFTAIVTYGSRQKDH